MQIKIHNAETGEIVERNMDDKELAQYQADKVATEDKAAKAEVTEIARAALLDRLGITADELKLLLG